jgi:hypothetical protein
MLSLKYRNSFKPSCFDCFICSKYYTGIFSPESSGSFYIRSFSYIYITSFAPASSVVQSRQLMLPLSAALASREVLHNPLGLEFLRALSLDCCRQVPGAIKYCPSSRFAPRSRFVFTSTTIPLMSIELFKQLTSS